MIVSNNKLAIEAGFAKVLYKLRILKLSCANAKPSNFGLHVCADCLVIHREYFPNPRHEKRIRRIYANFVFLYLPASVDWNQSKRLFFFSKTFRPLIYFTTPNRIIHFILSKRILSVSDRKKFIIGCMYVYE